MKLKSKILDTILYANFFDYPLTFFEIWRYLHTSEKISKKELADVLPEMDEIEKKEKFYFLSGREKIVTKRLERERESMNKIKKARIVSGIFIKIPTVKLVGISGSLAIRNADSDEDIDVFVIAASGTVWFSRMVCILILKLLGVHRSRGDINVANLFCLNMIIAENNLSFKSKKSIYMAHEIMHLYPLVQKDHVYESLIKENSWIKNYVSNFLPHRTKSIKSTNIENVLIFLVKALGLDKISKIAQLLFMGKKMGKEQISDSILAFHPLDREKEVTGGYRLQTKY